MRLAQHDEHFRREPFAFPVGIGLAVVDVSADVHVGMRAGNDFLIEREILRFGEGDVLVSRVREARRTLRLGLVGRGDNSHDGGNFFFRLRQKGQARQRQGEHGGYDRTHFHERNFLSIMMVGVVMRVVGRAHLARQCASGRKSKLGGASEDAQSYWQGRFAACALLTCPLGLVGRGTVGALPQTPQGTLSLDPARGNCPLTPPRD